MSQIYDVAIIVLDHPAYVLQSNSKIGLENFIILVDDVGNVFNRYPGGM